MDRYDEAREALRQTEEKLKTAIRERDEAQALVAEMRLQVKDAQQLIEQWIEAFDMRQGEDGTWTFSPALESWQRQHAELLERHRKLVADWNKFAPEYNRTIRPREIGRPRTSSTAQQAEVKRRRKAGESLRKIARATGLTLAIVRTIIEAKAEKRTTALRRREFDRLRAAAYRARLRQREAIPGEVTRLQKEAGQLIKRAKGLG